MLEKNEKMDNSEKLSTEHTRHGTKTNKTENTPQN